MKPIRSARGREKSEQRKGTRRERKYKEREKERIN
jgi:hypothetical protein